MACTSGCRTKDHATYGECLRANNLSVMGLETQGGRHDYTATKRMHRENDAYRAAVKEGLQPEAVSFAAVDRARKAADTAGAPVQTY